jgi:hypothetical protein
MGPQKRRPTKRRGTRTAPAGEPQLGTTTFTPLPKPPSDDNYPRYNGLLRATPPNILYHYTSQEALLAILGGLSVRATHIRYLNDSAEFELALHLAEQIVRDRAEKLGSAAPPIVGWLPSWLGGLSTTSQFVFSLSNQNDQLSQWRGYCPSGNGVALGFHTGTLTAPLRATGALLLKCVYDRSEQMALLAELIDVAINNPPPPGENAALIAADFQRRFGIIASLIKHEKFREEDEWRVVTPWFAPERDVLVRPGKSMLIPFVELPIGVREPESISHPFARIVVGPTPHMQLAAAAAFLALRAAKLDGCGVVQSTIPYRSW